MKLAPDPLSRRRFVEWFARGVLGVKLAGAAAHGSPPAGRRARADHVIYLFLRGGLSHVDTFDPKPGREEMAGVGAIGTSADGVRISEWFPRLARNMHHVALVRSMTSTQGVHERGNYLAHTAFFQSPTITHPALGAWALRLLGPSAGGLPGNILINGSPQHPGAGFFGPDLAPLPVIDPSAGLPDSRPAAGATADDVARRSALADDLGSGFLGRVARRDPAAYRALRDQARALMRSEDLKAFDLSAEDPRLRREYGDTPFGQGCLLARRLVEHGVRFIEVEDSQNWDTHNDHVPSMRRMTPSLDQALAALLGDLANRGLLDRTLVVMATEFGRSPRISEVTAGRGHHPAAFTWWMAGGGVKGGYVHGSTDEAGERVAAAPVTMPDFNATIAHALGLPLEAEVRSPSGRPFTVAGDGRPLLSLFS